MDAKEAREIAEKNRPEAVKRLDKEEREKKEKEEKIKDEKEKFERDLLERSLRAIGVAAKNGNHSVELMERCNVSKLIASLSKRGFYIGDVREEYWGACPEDGGVEFKFILVCW